MNELPVSGYIEQITSAVAANDVVIIRAETGAGKSTQIPKYLARECGYRVLCTQPRRLAASSLADRVASEWPCAIGEEVGFKTAIDGEYSDSTKCLFVTDGLALVRALLGGDAGYDVLVIDEIHEWNLNVEILLAWALANQKSPSRKFKIVIMSATFSGEKLSEFCGHAPIISIPGRLFPITTQPPSDGGHHWIVEMGKDITRLVSEGRNSVIHTPLCR